MNLKYILNFYNLSEKIRSLKHCFWHVFDSARDFLNLGHHFILQNYISVVHFFALYRVEMNWVAKKLVCQTAIFVG